MSEASPPFKIFVSHIHEEAPLAAIVKEWLEDAFPDRVKAFVSSSPKDNPGGDQWLTRLARELKDPQTRMLISLVSPQSIREPWISIELGAAWIRDHAVFPLCHSGQSIDQLATLMHSFGGAELDQDNKAAERLIGAVEQATGLRVSKRFPIDEFLQEMRLSLRAGSGGTTPRAPVNAVPRPSAHAGTSEPHIDLAPEEVVILQVLAGAHNHGVEEIPTGHLAGMAKLKPANCTYHVDRLRKLGFIHKFIYSGGSDTKILPPGIGWLIEHNALPE